MNEPFFTVTAKEKTANYAQFEIEPLPQGYGSTLGNSLRRILLSSIPGTAISKLKIKGAKHQFSTLKGLREDIVELILNLKKVNFHLEGEQEAKLTLEKKGVGEVTAKDITLPAEVTISNPDEYIASLTDKNTKLEMTIWVEQGMGYVPSEDRLLSEMGSIPVDSLYSPVRRVNFSVEETRVGRETNFDKLILDVWTNGAIDPETALTYASQTLVSYFQHMYNPQEGNNNQPKQSVSTSQTVLKSSVEELELPIRITNALKKGGFATLADFEGKSRTDVEKVRNLGAKSIDQIQDQLKKKGVVLVS
ncbi:MAG: DNA-directed RNA polymerase subunit alpha [Microgenomates group bacterium GW2011_GWC1_41_8]|uniref:DNA-directed RNA polymerase subunit alpha n=3 Tax=Candidatus Roizmaniibacteriota TaxID=1752723 RepID=A0A0G0ZMA0_9BACT|nr:MAG: DNA-directed RNA polymerase subunit alpha [Candidatus Roizmanbacteria bacterium GW2011_GWB1_40_7]KKR94579.1 MAG: DNA-directed RNA polymerase subunit alpha [Candidatus Roizmanbacteria bacterium GW2011_GWA1_41_13]KKS23161.1 MAG: DNA-directed RNA polymerase subunit alpha [Candidatus Roizmanbacteria bacterium GW2011_GWC2_41_7]KKS24267.1 MAG: DNA-directed RNA polymerase subunit alpha [Microgenomates group bacterium GW2011_GWC1_41_8]OGK48402.1 MAG: DNA-directed RNA polymerase subunit alpha [C